MYFLSMEDFCERDRKTKRVFNTHLKDFQAVSNSMQPFGCLCLSALYLHEETKEFDYIKCTWTPGIGIGPE